MNEALKVVLSLSLSGTMLMLVLLALSKLFKDRLSKGWQYYIWLVVVVRLILPFAPQASLGDTLFKGVGTREEQLRSELLLEERLIESTRDTDAVAGGQSAANNAKSDVLTQGILAIAWENLWLIWFIGVLILLIRKITIYQSFVKYIRAGSVAVADIEVLEQFGHIVEGSKISRTVELCTNSMVATPLMIGFFRPCIVLPTLRLATSDFGYIIRHELMHCKRGDMFYKWLVQFAVCLHWFNPFVYLMSGRISRACELSCDEAVVQKLDSVSRRAYGDTLLNSVGSGGNYRDALASVTLNESKELLKERLDSIMKFRKMSKSATAIAVLCAMLLCIGGTAMGAYAVPFI